MRKEGPVELGALRESCGGVGTGGGITGGGPADPAPALPDGGKWRGGGSLHDPFSPLTSGPFAVFLFYVPVFMLY